MAIVMQSFGNIMADEKDKKDEKEEFPQEWTEHIEEIIEKHFKRHPEKRKH